MSTYTVLLQRPGLIGDTYLWQGETDGPANAVYEARFAVCIADGEDLDNGIDYAVLLVIAGRHDDLNPEL